jgi:hypothetical protein
MEDVAGGMTDTEDVTVAWNCTRRRVVRFDPATDEQLKEWKEGKRPLWRFELMWPDGEWEVQGMCDRVEC